MWLNEKVIHLVRVWATQICREEHLRQNTKNSKRLT